jgi:hypothetical protein
MGKILRSKYVMYLIEEKLHVIIKEIHANIN